VRTAHSREGEAALRGIIRILIEVPVEDKQPEGFYTKPSQD